jgi:outer membrane lipoprotein-sorting protein
MGSDMSYEDLSSRELDENTFTLIGQEVYDSISCHLLEAIPKENIRSAYSRHITWVDPTLLIPLKEKSYDKSGLILKEKYFTYEKMDIYQILKRIQVTNVQKNHSTHLKFENIEIDTGVKDGLFHERHLKRLPK